MYSNAKHVAPLALLILILCVLGTNQTLFGRKKSTSPPPPTDSNFVQSMGTAPQKDHWWQIKYQSAENSNTAAAAGTNQVAVAVPLIHQKLQSFFESHINSDVKWVPCLCPMRKGEHKPQHQNHHQTPPPQQQTQQTQQTPQQYGPTTTTSSYESDVNDNVHLSKTNHEDNVDEFNMTLNYNTSDTVNEPPEQITIYNKNTKNKKHLPEDLLRTSYAYGYDQMDQEIQVFGTFVMTELRGLQNNNLRKKAKRKIQQILIDIAEEDMVNTSTTKEFIDTVATETIVHI